MRIPMLISYPRSGRSWLKQAVRAVTGYPLNGVHSGNSRRGRKFYRNHDCDSLILLLRDPAVSWARRATCNYRFRIYAQNILYYDQFADSKLLLHYENIFEPRQIYAIADWLKLPYEPFGDFEAVRQQIFKRYHKNKRVKYERRDPTPEEIVDAHKRCKQLLPSDIYEKYLGRYVS